MIVAMWETASEDQIQGVTDHLMKMGFAVHRTTGARQTVLAAVGKRIDFDIRELEVLLGRADGTSHQRALQAGGRTLSLRGNDRSAGEWASKSGARKSSCMAGPCSVESREQIFAAARDVKRRARKSCGAALSSRAARPTRFRAWVRTRSNCCAKPATASG